MLLNNIIEEKSNRIIEVLLSSVTPGELMMGKLLGIAAIGLTMVGVWMVGPVRHSELEIRRRLGHRRPASLVALKTRTLIPLFVIYFLLGYLMYAAFILSLGSVCNTIKEAQKLHGHDYDAHDGPAADHDLYPQGPQRHPGPGAFLDSDSTLPSP